MSSEVDRMQRSFDLSGERMYLAFQLVQGQISESEFREILEGNLQECRQLNPLFNKVDEAEAKKSADYSIDFFRTAQGAIMPDTMQKYYLRELGGVELSPEDEEGFKKAFAEGVVGIAEDGQPYGTKTYKVIYVDTGEVKEEVMRNLIDLATGVEHGFVGDDRTISDKFLLFLRRETNWQIPQKLLEMKERVVQPSTIAQSK